ncbi:hypothetical protein KAS42_02460 [bacterium]|nr:hypothetical protein [bacterium]
MDKIYNGPEALEWFKKNDNPSALASNHFGPTEKAVAFVEKLYEAGVQEVRISQECIRDDEETIKEEGGPYADGIIVVLPFDANKKQAVVDMCAKESDSTYSKPEIKNNMIFLWWD